MPKSRAQIQRLDRRAAASLLICAGFIVGGSFLVLSLTVWRGSVPVEKEVFYRTLPGVDMGGLAPERAETLLKQLNAQRCHCGCMRTMAGCRNHHGSCTESLAIGRDAVAAAKVQ